MSETDILIVKSAALEKVRAHVRRVRGKAVSVKAHDREVQEDAPGIPDRTKRPPLPRVASPQKWILSVSRHDADRAGRHFDVRLVDLKGRAHSFATRYFPGAPGETVTMAHQPPHTGEYATKFEGEIKSGYGKGRVKLLRVEPIEVRYSTGEKLTFFVHGQRRSEEFTLFKQPDSRWRLVNHTPTKARFPAPAKEKLKSLPQDKLDSVDVRYVTGKIDGARSVVHLPRAGGHPRVTSYRLEKGSGEVIDYTHKIEGLWSRTVPGGMGGSVLIGETHARDWLGRALPSSEISGMLNSSVERSRAAQKKRGKLRVALFNVVRWRGRDMSAAPFEEKIKVMEEVARAYPEFEVVPWAFTPEARKKLLRRIFTNKHPRTSEGAVVHSADGKVHKVKPRPDHDVYVRGVYPGKGRLKDRSAGGFEFSWTPKGEVKGRIGTGLSDALRTALWQDPERYLGLVAQVEAQEKLPSGALRGSSFSRWHVDKNMAAAPWALRWSGDGVVSRAN